MEINQLKVAEQVIKELKMHKSIREEIRCQLESLSTSLDYPNLNEEAIKIWKGVEEKLNEMDEKEKEALHQLKINEIRKPQPVSTSSSDEPNSQVKFILPTPEHFGKNDQVSAGNIVNATREKKRRDEADPQPNKLCDIFSSKQENLRQSETTPTNVELMDENNNLTKDGVCVGIKCPHCDFINSFSVQYGLHNIV